MNECKIYIYIVFCICIKVVIFQVFVEHLMKKINNNKSIKKLTNCFYLPLFLMEETYLKKYFNS
jgi:hypothetical protein